MPANVSYEYSLAQKHYDAASGNDEKLVALQEMLSTAPTHKGAENLRKDISRKIASLKNKMEKQAAISKKSGHTLNIKKEGDGQVVVVGLPNSGKSTFLKEYTNATPTIANYPYTTTKPELGTLNYGGALIQIVELPSFLNNGDLSSQIFSMVRVADLVIFVIKNKIAELDELINYLESKDVFVTKARPKIEIVKSKFLGVSFVNEQNLKVDKNKATNLLKDSGYRSHTLILNEKTDMEALLLLINPRACFIPAICVSMRNLVLDKDPSIYKNIKLFNFEDNNIVCDSIFEALNKVIVYTKRPGRKVDTTEPLVLDKGASVTVAAKEIHKNIGNSLKSAKVWGSTKYPGQNVSKNYILKNKDIVEFVI